MSTSPETSSRRVRRQILSWLPDGPRTWLRRFYERVSAPADRAQATFTDCGATVVLQIAGGPSITLLPQARGDIERQFRDPEAAAELSRFMSYTADPGVLFDVGANYGLFALVYCLANRQSRAVAFEPSPRLAATIRQLADLNGVADRLRVVDKAVAEAIGVRELLLDLRGGYVQSAAFAGTTSGSWHTATLPLTTLDHEVAVVRPTIVKIDIEGYEHEALLGADMLLADVRPMIFLELHLNYLQARQIAPSDVVALLTRHRYRLEDLRGRRRSVRGIARSWASVLHLTATPLES
ncbi:unnamed protein product [uncultured bacterium]|nr:unnamed protein product [uncultured bacterium]